MILIESKENKIYKETKKLKDRKNRSKNSKYIIEGFRLVEEAFKAGLPIEYLLISTEGKEKYEYFLGKYSSRNVKKYEINEGLLKDICSTEKPQGVAAIVSMCDSSMKLEGDFYLLCDKIQDPGNLGTIIRTAHAAGVDGIILTKGTVDVYNEKTIRATMGSLFYVPIINDDENNSVTKKLIDKGFSLLATSLEGDKDFFEEDLSGRIIVSVGNEGNGVSEEIYNLSDKKVKVPMPGGAESLNVAIATSVILYEKVRQNHLKLK